ncbi:hypothetical protein Ancab_010580 [Ancistrocladus abbreviatus]
MQASLMVSKDLRVVQSFEELEGSFEPGEQFSFGAVLHHCPSSIYHPTHVKSASKEAEDDAMSYLWNLVLPWSESDYLG